MHFYLVDINPNMCGAWRLAGFADDENVTIVEADVKEFLTNNRMDIVASPGNGFAILDGGLDLIFKEMLPSLESTLQRKIREQYLGELSVGAAVLVDIQKNPYWIKQFVYAPTMRSPYSTIPIMDPRIAVYSSTRSAIVAAINSGADKFMLPGFGGMTGRQNPILVAKYMYLAYCSVCSAVNGLRLNYSWDEINKTVRDMDSELLGYLFS